MALFNPSTLELFNVIFTCLRHPVMRCARNNFASASSVSRFPRVRMRDSTSERFDLVNTSGIFVMIFLESPAQIMDFPDW